MQSVDVNGLQITYERTGEGAPLMLLHGLLSSSRAWVFQLAELSDEFDVIAWDAPGAGGSPDPPETFATADWADALNAFLGELETGPAHLAGLSWGGVIAQELYRRHPDRVRSLILVDSYAGWKGSLTAEECAARVRSSIAEADMPAAEVVRRWVPGLLSPSAPPELIEAVSAGMAGFHPGGFRTMACSLGDTDTRDLLPSVDVPTLLVWGEADARSPLRVAEQLRDAIPRARLVVIPEAGHICNVEQPTRFNAAVREFCREH